MIFFLLSESIFLTSTFPSFLQILRDASNFSTKNLFSFALFKFFELILPTYQGPYSWQHQVQTHATHHLQSDPSWISLQANHLNSCIWKSRFWKPVRILHENRIKIKESSYLTSSSVAFTQRTSHKVPNVNNLMHALGIRRNIVANNCTRRLLFYRWAGRPTVLTPVNKNFSRLLTLICFIWRWMSFYLHHKLVRFHSTLFAD